MRARHWLGYFPASPDAHWAANEAARIRDAAQSGIWILLVAAPDGHEDTDLMTAVRRRGGLSVDSASAVGVIAYRVRFVDLPPGPSP